MTFASCFLPHYLFISEYQRTQISPNTEHMHQEKQRGHNRNVSNSSLGNMRISIVVVKNQEPHSKFPFLGKLETRAPDFAPSGDMSGSRVGGAGSMSRIRECQWFVVRLFRASSSFLFCLGCCTDNQVQQNVRENPTRGRAEILSDGGLPRADTTTSRCS